jgi:hypothetical protein
MITPSNITRCHQTSNIEYRISLEWGATLTHSRRIKQDKTRQDKTRQDETRQDETRQDETRSKHGRVPNLGFTKVSAALVGLSALVFQVLSGDAGDTTLQHGSNAEAGTANLREQGE